MRRIKVAVLDSGLSDKYEKDKKIIVSGRKHIYYDYILDRIVMDDDTEDLNGHGTMCVSTMVSVFENIDFEIVKMLNVSGVTCGSVLLKALEYVNTTDVDIVAVCASLTEDEKDEKLQSVCDDIYNSGKILVVSLENGKKCSEPACYKNVIGVYGGNIPITEYNYIPNLKIQMQCSSEAVIAHGAFGLRTIFMGNSKATALAVGHIARILSETGVYGQKIYDVLKKNGNTSANKDFSVMSDHYTSVEFDNVYENKLLECDVDYQAFLYLLCEFFLCDDPQLIRVSNLINFNNRYILRKLESFLRLVELKFKVEFENVMIGDIQWAYLFYVNNIYPKMHKY